MPALFIAPVRGNPLLGDAVHILDAEDPQTPDTVRRWIRDHKLAGLRLFTGGASKKLIVIVGLSLTSGVIRGAVFDAM